MLFVFGWWLMIKILDSPESHCQTGYYKKTDFTHKILGRFYGKIQDRVGLSPTMRVPRFPIE
jgi:hypothetical protein